MIRLSSLKIEGDVYGDRLTLWAIKARYLSYPVAIFLVLFFFGSQTAIYKYFLSISIIAIFLNILCHYLYYKLPDLKLGLGIFMATIDTVMSGIAVFLTGGYQSPFFILFLLQIFGVGLLGNAILTFAFLSVDAIVYIISSHFNSLLRYGSFVFINSNITQIINHAKIDETNFFVINIVIFVLITLIVMFVNTNLNSAVKRAFSEKKQITFLLNTMERLKKLEPINKFLREMTDIINDILGYRYNSIILLNKERTELHLMEYSPKSNTESINALLGFKLEELRVPMHSEANIVVKAVKERDTMITHAEWDLLIDALPPVTESIAIKVQQTTGTKTFIIVPIIAFGDVIGAIELESRLMNIDEDQIKLLESFASQLGSGIVNNRLYTETLKQKEEIEKHYQEMNSLLGELQSSYSRLEDFTKDLELSKHKLEEMKSILYHTDKLANMGQVIASITHQLSSPISVIAGQVELLTRELENSGVKAGKDRIEKIKLSVNKLDESVKKLMSSVRLTKTEFKLINVNEIINSVTSLWEYELKRADIQLIKKLDDRLPDIEGISEAIEQMLVNLISNARDAMENKKGNIVISTRLFDKNNIEIEVQDQGIGIPDAELKKIFTPFFTTKPPGKGTGLGMVIVMNAIEEHNGRLLVKSELNKGTIFTIILPVKHTHGGDKPI